MADWKKFIEEKREEIEETLKEALRLSYENHNLCNVILTPDGKIEILEDVSHGRESYEWEHFLITSFDNQFNGPVDDYYDDEDILLESYESEFTEAEREKYAEAITEEMSANERISWIKENCPDAAGAVYEYAFSEICSDMDFEEIIDDALDDAEKIAFAEKIKANREEIIDAVYEQYKAHWKGTQQMRYYVYVDHETGKPSSYEHYGSPIYPENVWDGTDPLIAEYTADGISPEEAENDSQYLQNVIEYMDDEQLEQFEEWKNSDEYKKYIAELDEYKWYPYRESDIRDYQFEWIEEHTDAYERYCEDIINERWKEEELPGVEDDLDELIEDLQG